MNDDPLLRAAVGRACDTGDGGAGTPRIATVRAVGGGSICHSRLVGLDDGRRLFVKTRSDAPEGLCEAEHRALQTLAACAPEGLCIPCPLASGQSFIALQALDLDGAPRAAAWQTALGQGLARLHLASRRDGFGLGQDNFIGLSPQPNGWCGDWIEFWREHRLGWQLEMFARRAGPDDALLKAGRRLQARLADVLAHPPEPAVALHGDLWSGNAGALSDSGTPALFDPALYYGHREAEFGMMRLFGGFGARCETAYGEIWPLADGADRRILCYRLYHELNHLNLFGGGYYQSCLDTLRRLL